ncbi:uncharacterized protein LOC131026135 [Salvia miltiorrhiza]|uniref:uncharacterized protein LOC131026135 n=1 Tax=Salvia miltiorrhiza TaxID=226208 RepID=UPI0025AB96AC|nr:uncharacterized protein LOC131026135 [Salvia miltiorrhiza]
MALPIEITSNQVEIQLVPAEDIKRDLQRMKPEVANQPTDVALCDKRIRDAKVSVLGAFSDSSFSRALTLYQDYKKKDLMTGGNMPYSLTYQVSYALSNSHHTELFLGKEFIEVPEIFKEVAKTVNPNRVEIPQIREIDIEVGDK